MLRAYIIETTKILVIHFFLKKLPKLDKKWAGKE